MPRARASLRKNRSDLFHDITAEKLALVVSIPHIPFISPVLGAHLNKLRTRTAVWANGLAVAFAIAPHAVQDRCLGPDACIHAMPLSLLTLAPQRDAVVKLPVTVPTKSHSVGIVTLRNRTLSPSARLFIEKTREVIEPLRKG